MSSLERVDRGLAQVGVFGKHPAWDDFVERLGDREESLGHWEHVILGGVLSLVESGKWDPAVLVAGRAARPTT